MVSALAKPALLFNCECKGRLSNSIYLSVLDIHTQLHSRKHKETHTQTVQSDLQYNFVCLNVADSAVTMCLILVLIKYMIFLCHYIYLTALVISLRFIL